MKTMAKYLPRLALLAGVIVASGAMSGARANQVEVDLGQHLVSINYSFTGAEVLLFGAKDGDGDVVVVLRGPAETAVVRRKARTAGIWINRDLATFEGIPGYYAVASSRPLAEIGTPEMFEVNQIGLDNLRLKAVEPRAAAERADFRAALVRNKERAGLYVPDMSEVRFMGGLLFRTSFTFPANVPTGRYRAEIYLIDGGRLVDKRVVELDVRKTGVEATIYAFANQEPFLYGVLAVILALVAGWSAATFFRKA